MAAKRSVVLRRYFHHGISVLGIVALSVLAMSLVQHAMSPPRATAQSSQPQEVRASAFVLVGADGSVLGRLAPGGQGGGRLTLYDGTGTQRTALAAAGVLAAFDTDGKTLRFIAGWTPTPQPPNQPVVNGVQLDPGGGTISTLPALPQDVCSQPGFCGRP